MAKQAKLNQSLPKTVKVIQWQVMYDDVNNKHVKVDATERPQEYEQEIWDELIEPRKELGDKSRFEVAGYRYKIVKDEVFEKETETDDDGEIETDKLVSIPTLGGTKDVKVEAGQTVEQVKADELLKELSGKPATDKK